MVPAKRDLIDLGESQATSLVGVYYAGEVVVEVMEGSIAAGRPSRTHEPHPWLRLLRVRPHLESLISRIGPRIMN
jgi:hypothetical protein